MNHLDAAALSKIRSLELEARQAVEGCLSGRHRSAQHGFAVEFAQHREYAHGDDTRHIDWKVFGRTERFFLKQYEMETNLVCWLLVDASESMLYGSGAITKYDYAAKIAAALSYLVLKQSDSFGLALFDRELHHFLRPSAQSAQLQEALRILATGATTFPSQIGTVLHAAAERFQRRGIVIILSDLFDDIAPLAAGLRHLKYRNHDVVVFQVLDPAEIEFPFRRPTLFKGLEAWSELLTDPLGIRESYLREFQAFHEGVTIACRSQNVDYISVRTDEDVGGVIGEFLTRRSKR